MSGDLFVDTNVLVYARDAGERRKGRIARDWLERLWRTGRGRLSYQVLTEYYVTVTAKLTPGLAVADARADVRDLLVWRPVVVGGEILDEAFAVQDRWGLSWWDSLIVAAARAVGCAALLTEDLQDEQDLDGLRVVDPFSHAPAEWIPGR